MAKVIPIGQPANESERLAIAHLRDHLSDSYLIVHNFEIHRDNEVFEIDIALLAPHAVYLIDVKGTRGHIEAHGNKWYPEGRQPFNSPLPKLRQHARALKGLITESQPSRRELEKIYVDAAVLLTASDAHLTDADGRDQPHTTTLRSGIRFFQDAERIPERFRSSIGVLHSIVLKAIQAKAKARSGPLQYGNWIAIERLGRTDTYTEYRGYNAYAGERSGSVLLRVYQAEPYQPDTERTRQKRRIANAYQALNRLPSHPNILAARDFFPTEAEDRYILVTEDVPGRGLRLHITKPNLALTLDQKMRVLRDVLAALAHAHAHEVVHRNLNLGTILVGDDQRTRLIGFDYARSGGSRSSSIAQEIVDELDPHYQAPECQGEPGAASPASDMFSAGLIFYELFTAERPFADASQVFDQSAVFPVAASAQASGLPEGFDAWLQKLCSFSADERPEAAAALAELQELRIPRKEGVQKHARPPSRPVVREELDYHNLEQGTQLTSKYVVQKRLGKPGGFGVVYKVIDTLGDVNRAIKLILQDRSSVVERLKKEYRTLLRIPDHPNVVKVIDADLGSEGMPPFIVFDYVEGFDVGEMIEEGIFNPADGLELGAQVATGLVHLHQHELFHCDIKPRNLLWTDRGVKIIDFNVSIFAPVDDGQGGGSRRYLPPDLDLDLRESDNIDRDLYALGVTLYEAVTGRYPWTTSTPPAGKAADDPREISGLGDLNPELVEIMLKAIAPRRTDRFATAEEMRGALSSVKQARRSRAAVEEISIDWTLDGMEEGERRPNTNPFVTHLLTLYSQSQHSNAGTRGLDALGEQTYVETALDRELVPAVLIGEFKLVIITGNAGDGKTAFLQKLETNARDEGAQMEEALANGRRFSLRGRSYLSNYDGSQDEDERSNDEVLQQFFAPFADEVETWPKDETRLIAINEGRLVDFLQAAAFLRLRAIVQRGLGGGSAEDGVAVVNLNLRSVVTDPQDFDGSILERLIRRMAHEKFWEPCAVCDLRDHCYALHNACTLQDPVAGPKVIERLKTIYTLTHLRGRLHITLRDLRSALSFMLVGTRNCVGIHELYRSGQRDQFANGFYFNSWMGGEGPSADRLLALLKEMDMGRAVDARLDRALDFSSPQADRTLFHCEERSGYDREVLQSLYEELPRDYSGQAKQERGTAHRRYVAMARRRYFFERRDGAWIDMMPFHTAREMLELVRGKRNTHALLPEIIRAINSGEGLSDTETLGHALALQVRTVEYGTIRSYRVFPADCFELALQDEAGGVRFVEHMPSGMVLRYENGAHRAELPIDLDTYEMLARLNRGYKPSVEEVQGYYLSLAVFKNLLASAPYQEVLLTPSGYDFYRVRREEEGRLNMERLEGEEA